MKSINFIVTILLVPLFTLNAQSDLELKGVLDLDLPTAGSTGKAIHVRAVQNISDLSIYGIGVANNGGGSDGQEYTFPAISLNSGEEVIVCRDTVAISSYFVGCNPFDFIILDDQAVITQNGDDAIELFENGIVIETFGDINVDGTGEPWEYKDSWAYKDASGSVTFNGLNWIMGGVDCTDGSTTSLTSNCPYPKCITQPGNISDITFKVDMSQVSDPFSIPELNGTFNNWCGDCNPMSDANGDEIWEVTLSLNIGDTIEYKFSADNWLYQETNDPNGSCTNGDPNYTNRVLVIPSTSTVLNDVCWGSCDPCATLIKSSELNQINLSPNPCLDNLEIISKNNFKFLEIFNSIGEIIYSKNLNTSSLSINTSIYSKGVYFVRIHTDNKLTLHRFIKY